MIFKHSITVYLNYSIELCLEYAVIRKENNCVRNIYELKQLIETKRKDLPPELIEEIDYIVDNCNNLIFSVENKEPNSIKLDTINKLRDYNRLKNLDDKLQNYKKLEI